MNSQKREAPGEPRANHSLAANGKQDFNAMLREIKQNWHIFPLSKNAKIPANGSAGFHDAVVRDEALKRWPDIQAGNIGLFPGPSGLLVIDVDVKTHKDGTPGVGIETMKALQSKHGDLPETFTIKTPSGGWHLYFQKPDIDHVGNDSIGKDIDIRSDGEYVLTPGCYVIDPRYEGSYDVTKDKPIAALPEAWAALFKPKPKHAPQKPLQPASGTFKGSMGDYSSTSRADVQEALTYIPADLPYDEWVKVLAALHSEGFDDLAHSWSAGSPQYDPAEVDRKLASFKGSGIKIATVFHYAKQGGYKPAFSYPNPSDKSDISDKTPWPEPIPLAQVTYPKALDLRLMPNCLADVVGSVAEAIQAPRELAWGVAVSVLATAIGRRAKIELTTHIEPSPLWTCCILPPGSRKSGVFQVLTKPLADIEAELQDLWHEDWLRWQAEAELAEAAIQGIKAKLKAGKSDRKALAMELQEEKRTLEDEPVKPHLYLTDTTTEALRKALQEQGSIGLLSAEGSSIVESFGRYNGGNKGADMALFLAAHDGDEDKGARVSGTNGVREALASMGITAQPDVLQTLGRDRMARGRGFVSRFLFLIPKDPRGTRTYRNQPKLSPAIEKKWAQIIRRIMDIETQDTVPSVGVDAGAAEAWIDFAQEIEDKQEPGGELSGMAGFASKLAGAVGRIALAYHFAQGRDASSRIDAATMLQAIGTGLSMIDHARAAMQMMGEDEATARARLVLECLARNKMEKVKPRDIARNHWGGCKDVEEARAALSILCKHDYCRAIATERQSSTGAVPKDAYDVNPCVMSLLSPQIEGEKMRAVL